MTLRGADLRSVAESDILAVRTSQHLPAPGRLTADIVRRPRSLGLSALRKVSQAVSALAPARWGNRCFYVGARR